jgi:hypothetical protein
MRALLKSLLPRLESVELAAPPRRTCSIMVSGISSLSIRCAWRTPVVKNDCPVQSNEGPHR